MAIVLLLFLFTTQRQTLPRTITVSSEGKVKLQPDTLTIHFLIQKQAPTSKQAQEQMESLASTFLHSLQKLGIQKHQFQTVNYSIYPNQYREPSINKPKTDGYRATQEVLLQISGSGFLDLAEQVFRLAGEQGDILINSSQFSLTQQSTGEKEARQLAMDAAYQKASQLATAGGAKLGVVQTIIESQTFSEHSHDQLMAPEVKVLAASPEELPLQEVATLGAGEQELVVKLQVTYTLR